MRDQYWTHGLSLSQIQTVAECTAHFINEAPLVIGELLSMAVFIESMCDGHQQLSSSRRINLCHAEIQLDYSWRFTCGTCVHCAIHSLRRYTGKLLPPIQLQTKRKLSGHFPPISIEDTCVAVHLRCAGWTTSLPYFRELTPNENLEQNWIFK